MGVLSLVFRASCGFCLALERKALPRCGREQGEGTYRCRLGATNQPNVDTDITPWLLRVDTSATPSALFKAQQKTTAHENIRQKSTYTIPS